MSTIAVTNAVTGNVGSCKVEKTTVNIAPYTRQDIATNSCTGEVMTYPSYLDPSFIPSTAFLGVFIILILVTIWNLLFP